MRRQLIRWALPTLLVILLAVTIITPAVSADDYQYKGYSGIITAVDGTSTTRINTQQESWYYYSPSLNKWRVHIHATGGAQIWDNFRKQWLPAYGYYGLYAFNDGYWGTTITYGDETVSYHTTLRPKFQGFGVAQIADGDYYINNGPSGSYMSIKVAGNIGYRGVQANSFKYK